MANWKQTAVLKNIVNDLRNRSRRDFEAAATHVINVVEPGLKRGLELGLLDRAGIDAAAFIGEGEDIDLAVQYKGFELPGFGQSQLDQVESSVKSFLASGLKVNRFWIVQNREPRDAAFVAELDNLVSQVLQRGVANEARWFHLGTLLPHLFESLASNLRPIFERRSREFYEQYQHSFIGNAPIIPDVATEDGYDSVQDRILAVVTSAVACAPRGGRQSARPVVVLKGSFGTGKTLALLGAALRCRAISTPIYLPVALLARDAFDNQLQFVRAVCEVLQLAPTDDDLHGVMTATVLRERLRTDPELVLFLDAQDEHLRAHDRSALASFAGSIGEFAAQVVVSARSEYLLESGFLQALVGNTRDFSAVHIVPLGLWSDSLISRWCREYILIGGEDTPVRGLTALAQLADVGAVERALGDIPRRPIFLEMAARELEAGPTLPSTLFELYERAALRKFRRDFAGTFGHVEGRPQLFRGSNGEQERRLMEFHGKVSMSLWVVGGNEPAATLSEDQLGRIAQDAGMDQSDTAAILACSLLVPIGVRTTRRPLQIGFAHRSFQDFFCAWGLRSLALSGESHPRGWDSQVGLFIQGAAATDPEFAAYLSSTPLP